MATEDFKHLTEELFNNYVVLHEKMEQRAGKPISLDFKEYVSYYLKYEELDLNSFEFDDYDEEDSSEDEEE